MHYLVYLSAAAPFFKEEDLKEILFKSRKNNTRAGITGLLLFHEGNFIQVLEGNKADISALYERIALDHRHKLLIKLVDEPTEKRNFPDWSMGYKAVSTDEIRKLTGFDSINKKEFLDKYQHSENQERKIVILLRSFVMDNFQ
ncbi:MAG TPA: BLUF domain-containing protein [Chitinophagaceae bacterium]|jgi:ATP-dependent helicase YprA (DUF1998 family)|nr:BLUF domain-containing protein [Chitinophagaceae bacterium]